MEASLKTKCERDLNKQLDCVLTPDMEDYDIRCNKKSALINQVKRISYCKSFFVSVSK